MPPIYIHLANLVFVSLFLFSLYQREVRHRLVYIIQSRKTTALQTVAQMASVILCDLPSGQRLSFIVYGMPWNYQIM